MVFKSNEKLSLAEWFQMRDHEEQQSQEIAKKESNDKKYVEKGNKDEVFRYHISRIDEAADSLQEDPVLTNEDFVLGVRPESIGFSENGKIDSVIYGAMPTGMESTIKAAVGNYLLTSVIFGSTVYRIGEGQKLSINGNNILLFDRKSGKCIASGSLEIVM